MKRYGSLIGLSPEALNQYKTYLPAVWPEVLAMIQKCNIRNYSIFLKDGLLFSYFEYHGTNYPADMARMAASPKTQEWWAIMMPM
jgi:L-rhamnose mutarotase